MAQSPASAQAVDRAQQRLLAALLDELLPARPEVGLAGAGALGLSDAVAAAAAEKPDLASVLADGLARVAALAERRGAGSFAGLAATDRRATLDELGAQAPGFLPVLCVLTYSAYYRDLRVLEALGHPARPPYPLGYEVPPSDFTLLDAVRRRPPFYRMP
jgi:hypothetical protein